MTKQQKLEILMLLSAIESWSFAVKSPFPDYLHERLGYTMDMLVKGVLEDGRV